MLKIFILSVLAGMIAMIFWHAYASIPVAWVIMIALTKLNRKAGAQ